MCIRQPAGVQGISDRYQLDIHDDALSMYTANFSFTKK